MKKQLFSILTALSFGGAIAQTASPSWTTLQSPSFTIPVSGCRFVDAVDANVVWLAGYDGQAASLNYNFFSRTIDGGQTYNSGNVFPDTNTYALSNLEGIDANTAWVCAYNKSAGGGGVLYRTTNGGTSWTNMTPPGMYTNTAAFGNWIGFLTPNVAIVNGDPVNGDMELWRTTDAGATFTQVPGANIPDPIAGEFAIVDMYAHVGPSHFWFGTNKGRVYRSADAGVTWNVSTVSGNTTFTSSVIEVRFATPSKGLALIFQNNAYGLYNTYDGGATWNLIPGGPAGVPLNFGVNEMARVPGTEYFVSAGNFSSTNPNIFAGLSYSKDNGLTWTDWGSTNLSYVSIDFADRWHGWSGGFTNVPDNNWPGMFKYTGTEFENIFSVPNNICIGSTNVSVTPVNSSSAATGPMTFTWSSAPGAIISSANASAPVITFTSAGTYTISLDATSQNGVTNTKHVVNVVSCAAPAASFSLDATGCNKSFMILKNTSSGSPAPNVTVTTNPSANVQIVAGTNNEYTLIFENPGTYTVNMLGSSIAGTSSATQTVTINDCRPVVTFDMEEIVCRKLDTVKLVHNITGTAQSYTWSVNPTTGIMFIKEVPSGGTVPNGDMILITDPSANPYTSYTVTLMVGNQSGVTTYTRQLTVTVDNCVGLDEHADWRSQWNIYPNPAHDHLSITLPENQSAYTVELINVLGEIVYSKNIQKGVSGNVSVDVTRFGSGVYFVKVLSGKSQALRKFIIE